MAVRGDRGGERPQLVPGLAGRGVQHAGLDRADEHGPAGGDQHRDQAGAQQPADAPGAVHVSRRAEQRLQRGGVLTAPLVRLDWMHRLAGEQAADGMASTVSQPDPIVVASPPGAPGWPPWPGPAVVTCAPGGGVKLVSAADGAPKLMAV